MQKMCTTVNIAASGGAILTMNKNGGGMRAALDLLGPLKNAKVSRLGCRFRNRKTTRENKPNFARRRRKKG